MKSLAVLESTENTSKLVSKQYASCQEPALIWEAQPGYLSKALRLVEALQPGP